MSLFVQLEISLQFNLIRKTTIFMLRNKLYPALKWTLWCIFFERHGRLNMHIRCNEYDPKHQPANHSRYTSSSSNGIDSMDFSDSNPLSPFLSLSLSFSLFIRPYHLPLHRRSSKLHPVSAQNPCKKGVAGQLMLVCSSVVIHWRSNFWVRPSFCSNIPHVFARLTSTFFHM